MSDYKTFDSTYDFTERAIALEASAGTGKTHSITDLFLRYVLEPEMAGRQSDEEPVEASQILVVTFTNAATAEMRDRIRSRLVKVQAFFEGVASARPVGGYQVVDPLDEFLLERAKIAGGGDLKKGADIFVRRLTIAISSFDEMTISTIHGFCQRMLTANAFESKTEFNTELVASIEDVLLELVTDFYVRKVGEFGELKARILRKDKAGTKWLVDVAKAVASGSDVVFLPQLGGKEQFDPQLEADWLNQHRKYLQEFSESGDEVQGWLDENRAKLSGFGQRDVAEMLQGIAEVIATRSQLEKKIKNDAIWEYEDETPEWEAQYNERKFVTGDIKFISKRMVNNNLKKGFGEIVTPSLFEKTDEFLTLTIRSMKNRHYFLQGLRLELVEEIRAKLSTRQRQLHIQTFDDLLRRMKDGVIDAGDGQLLRKAITDKYKVVFIDEFQDTDPVQWAIFDKVFVDPEVKDTRIWIIGDPKQSIYGFRNADINSYIDARDKTGQKYRLETNWRSDEPLVFAVNTLFGCGTDVFLTPGIGYQDVNPQHEKRWKKKDGQATKPFRFGNQEKGDGNDDQIAEWTANDIRDFLSDGNQIEDKDSGEYRDVTPRDIAVLVRAHKNAKKMQNELGKRGIPSVRRSDEIVFQTESAVDLLRVVNAIIDSTNRTIRNTALFTSIIGWGAEQLAALESGVGDGTDEAAVLTMFAKWREQWLKDGFMAMFRDVMSRRNIAARYLGFVDGERKLTDLLHLSEVLNRKAIRSRLRPHALQTYLADQINGADAEDDSKGGGENEALIRLESDDDAVKVITQHAAKGLQFPFVWVPFLRFGPNDSGSGSSEFDNTGYPIHEVLEGESAKGLAMWIARERPSKKFKDLRGARNSAERIRQAYVAVTRAIHGCTVVGGKNCNLKESKLNWEFAGLADVDEIVEFLKVSLDDITEEKYHPISNGSDGNGDLEARKWTGERKLDPLWHWSSFSTLTKGSKSEINVGSSDEDKNASVDSTTSEELEDRSNDKNDGLGEPVMVQDGDVEADLATVAQKSEGVEGQETQEKLNTPVLLDKEIRGKEAGSFMHSVFEDMDFVSVDSEKIRALIADKSDMFGVKSANETKLIDGFWATLKTPLGLIDQDGQVLDSAKGPRLVEIVKADTLRELDFAIPVSNGLDAVSGKDQVVTNAILAKAMGVHKGGRLPVDYDKKLEHLKASSFRGFLKGSIDLVFRWREVTGGEQKFYVVDYKSNRLGTGEESCYGDYVQSALSEAMAHHHYFLQYHLYTVALHRYLSWRMPGYDYDKHFGGVYYLFIRGMQGSAPTGDTGVFRDRPPKARIEELSRVLETPPKESQGE